MTVASGQTVYEYTTNGYGDEFNFTLPASRPVLAPSSILIEEIMYTLTAESNRKAESIGYPANRGKGDIVNSRHNTISDAPNWGGFYPKWVNEEAGTSGLFNPSPTGGHLDGALSVPLGNAPERQPAHISSRWLYDCKLQFRDVVAYVSRSSNSSQQEIFQDWFRLKGYTDVYAQSGFFFQEAIDLTESTNFVSNSKSPYWAGSYNLDTIDADEYQLMFKQSGVFNNTWLSSRHLNEVRIQPIPYIAGSSGTLLTANGHDKSDLTYTPLKPRYARTDGTLAFGYGDDAILYGDVLISGMTIMFSGNGLISYHENIHTPFAPAWTAIPNSGTFPVPSLASGYYRVGLGMEYAREAAGLTSGLFPWGTGMGDAFKCAVWPRLGPATPDNYTYAGEGESVFLGHSGIGTDGDEAFIVTDYMWATQRDDGNVEQSGLTWYNSIGISDQLESLTLDFYDASGISPHAEADMHTTWGREYENLTLDGAGSPYWSAGGWCHKQSNGKIYRCHTSGVTTQGPGTAFSSGAYVTEWDTPLRFSSVTKYTPGTITRASVVHTTVIGTFYTLSWDGSDFVCGGKHIVATGDPQSTRFGGNVYFLDASLTGSYTIGAHAYTGDVTTNPYTNGRVQAIRYINTTSEYLCTRSPGWSPAIQPGITSGIYSEATFTFTGGTPAYDNHSGLMSEHFYTPDWGDNGLNYAKNVMQFSERDELRITDFFENEANDKVYAFCISETSGGSARSRFVSELDTSSHPYVLNRTWRLNSETTASQMSINLDNSLNSNFIQEFDY